MINALNLVDFFKKIAKQQFAMMILDDYDSEDSLIFFTDTISNIYKYLDYTSFESVTIYIALDRSSYLSELGANPTTIYALENLTPLQGKNIVLEMKENGNVDVVNDYDIDIDCIRQSSIIYTFHRHNETEHIYGKKDVKRLTPIPGSDSYFAIQTFKGLDEALDYYKSKIARYSECEILKGVWFDENRIFFKNGPEHRLRDSLTHYLKISLRNSEARPEQIVDKSHPVDIKITWALVNRLALIEIKWLGKSLFNRKKQFSKIYTEARALSGAKQLVNYLNENLKQSPTYASKGYLVVFDARRWNCNTDTSQISKNNAMMYLGSDINFDPNYQLLRSDFSKPFRFFMEPNYINS